jgi:single-strand DNA-binding protein
MINRVVLVGRLTKDVEVRKTTTGLSVASFTVACDRRGSRNQDAGSNQPSADFINCVAWRQTAEFLGSYARKGAMVGVDGRIQTRNYDGSDGRKVYVTEVVADSVQLLESRSQSQARAQSGYQDSYQQPSYQQPQSNYGYSDNSYNNNNGFGGSSNNGGGMDDGFGGAGLDISSDDLPF